MSAQKDFIDENFLRATRHSNRARILAHVLGPKMQQLFPDLFSSAPQIVALNNQGWTNLTIWLDPRDDTPGYILRLTPCSKDPKHQASRSLAQLEKERYILEKMSGSGLVPEMPRNASGRLSLDIPNEGTVEYGYLLEQRVPFEAANSPGNATERSQTLHQLGRTLRDVHAIKVAGYGVDFDEKVGGFSFSNFSAFLSSKVESLEQSPVDSSMKRWLTSRVRSLEQLDPEPRLFHQDLLGNWGNFLIDSTGTIRSLIDWEFAGSGPAFHFEIASFVYVLTRDGHDPDLIEHEVASVVTGYGMTVNHFKEHYERDVETIVLLHATSALQKYEAVRRSGRTDKEPWRRVFAERAQGTFTRSMKRDRTAT